MIGVLSGVPSSGRDLGLDGHIEAVVGSSAMSSLGLQDRAMAIITCCRIPRSFGGVIINRRSGRYPPV